MPRSRKIPVTALFVAIINLVLFVPCLCCSGAGLAMVGAGGGGSDFALDPKQKEELKKQEKIVEEKVPNQKAIGMAFSFGNVLGSILMIVAAIGLLKKQSWGRLVCIFGSILLIVDSLANVGYQAKSVLPVTVKIQEWEMREQNPGAAPPAGFV